MRFRFITFLLILTLFCSFVAAGKVQYGEQELFSPTLNIIKQDYFQDYINYEFEYLGDNEYNVTWKVTDDFVFDTVKECGIGEADCFDDKAKTNTKIIDRTGKVQDKKMYTEDDFFTNYFGEEMGTVKSDYVKLKTDPFPKKVLEGNMELIGDVDVMASKQGTFKVKLLDGFATDYKFSIGFGTLLVEFKSGESNGVINMYQSYFGGFEGTTTKYLRIPRFSTINNATINFTGTINYSAIYTEFDYFSTATLDNTVWTESVQDGGITVVNPSLDYWNSFVRIYATETVNLATDESYIISDKASAIDVRNSSVLIDYAAILNLVTSGNSDYRMYVSDGANEVLVKSESCNAACGLLTVSQNTIKLIINDSGIKQYNEMNGSIADGTLATTTLNNGTEWHLKFDSFVDVGGTGFSSGYAYLDVYRVGINKVPAEYNDFSNKYTGSYPNATLITVGGYTAFSQADDFKTEKMVNITMNLTNSLNSGACDCTGCAVSDSFCDIPLVFSSGNGNSMNFSNLLIGYNITQSNITINLKDSNTLSLITHINITVQMVGDIFQLENVTDKGTLFFSFPFNTSGEDTISIRGFENGSVVDYSLVVLEQVVSEGVVYNITMYLTNTSDTTKAQDVTFHVVDEISRNAVQNAVVSILKQDPATSTDLLITQITTGPDGEATTKLELDTVFYKFLVDTGGSRVYTSPNYVTLPVVKEDVYLYVNIASIFTDYFKTIYGTTVDLTFNRLSNSSGQVIADYSSSDTYEYCLKIYNITDTGYDLNSTQCVNGTTGTINSPVLNVDNVTRFWVALNVDTGDGEGFRTVRAIAFSIGENLGDYVRALGVESLIFPMLVVIFAWFGFLGSVYAGPIILIAGMVGIYKLGVTSMSIFAVMSIVSLALFSLTVLTKRDKK